MSCCSDNIEKLKKKFGEKQREARDLKENYQNLLVENLQTDLIIQQLKQKTKANRFSDFKGILSDECLDKLNLIGDLHSDDTTFVGIALKDLYRNDKDALKKRTLSGRSENGEKSVVTPEKINALQRLFKKRMLFMPEAEQERKDNLNKLIRKTIDNENRKK